jgi:hypothetical protein
MLKIFRSKKVETVGFGFYKHQIDEIEKLTTETGLNKSMIVRFLCMLGLSYLDDVRKNPAKLQAFILKNEASSVITEFPKLRNTETGKRLTKK